MSAEKIVARVFMYGLTFLVLVILAVMSLYTVPEGHAGVVKLWSKAEYDVGPGLHMKWPIANSVEIIEVRQRRNVEELAAATANQLPIQARVSINWTANAESVMELFIKYGGLDNFEGRILDPKLRSAAKAALSQFPADELIRNRNAAVAKIMENMQAALEGFPVAVNSPQIENIAFPPSYMEAILAKEKAREDAVREQHTLERQKLKALQSVNTAEANARAKELSADAEAYRITTEAEAEATAIEMVNKELARSPNYIELVKAKQWNGTLPTTMLAGETGTLLSLGAVSR